MKSMLVSIVLAASLSLAGAAFAGGPKDCAELRQEIALKLESNGVHGYSLQIVEPGAPSAGRVVGRCAGGSRHIVYQRLAIGDAALMALLVPPEAQARTFASESSAQDGL
jgi:hypothetical protein